MKDWDKSSDNGANDDHSSADLEDSDLETW